LDKICVDRKYWLKRSIHPGLLYYWNSVSISDYFH